MTNDDPNSQDELQKIIDLSEQFKQAYPEHSCEIDFEQRYNKDSQFRDFLHCFALITSQLEHQLNDGYHDISASLLDSLIPGLLQPKPSMTIAKIKAVTHQIQTIPKNTKITLSNHPHCQFRTTHNVQLYPFSIHNIIHSDGKLRIQLSLGTHNPKPDSLKSIRFTINSNQKKPLNLYHTLINNNPNTIKPIPLAQNTHPLQHLIDYFHHPYQFYFLDFYFDKIIMDHDFEITYNLTNNIDVNTKSLLLSCTPIINCFPHQAEPLIINPDKPSQTIVLDNQQQNLQLHSIKKITLTNHKRKIQCYKMFNHDYHLKSSSTLYWSVNGNSIKTNTPTEINFSDHTLLENDLPVIAHIKTLCSNGNTPIEYISDNNTQLQLHSDMDYDQQPNITLLRPLSPYFEPHLSDQQRFNLIQYSKISLNPLTQKENLLQLINLLAQSCNASSDKIANKIAQITTQPIKIRPNNVRYHCYHSGIQCTITLNTTNDESAEDSIFYALLYHSLMHYCPIDNVFILTIQNTTGETLREWNTTPGKHYLI